MVAVVMSGVVCRGTDNRVVIVFFTGFRVVVTVVGVIRD